jgi:hypothetical protein
MSFKRARFASFGVGGCFGDRRSTIRTGNYAIRFHRKPQSETGNVSL